MTRRTEHQQVPRAAIQHLAWARSSVFWMRIPLGGLRSKVEAAILRSLGTARGTPDVLIITDGEVHFRELKSAAGCVTSEQRVRHEALVGDAQVAVAHGVAAALAQFAPWGVLR